MRIPHCILSVHPWTDWMKLLRENWIIFLNMMDIFREFHAVDLTKHFIQSMCSQRIHYMRAMSYYMTVMSCFFFFLSKLKVLVRFRKAYIRGLFSKEKGNCRNLSYNSKKSTKSQSAMDHQQASGIIRIWNFFLKLFVIVLFLFRLLLSKHSICNFFECSRLFVLPGNTI